MTTLTDRTEFKDVIKEALVEVLTENKEQFQSLIMDSLEDIALSADIKEGESDLRHDF